jgi:putative DNA primase/helicase
VRYCALGLGLVPLDPGTKKTERRGWNLVENAIRDNVAAHSHWSAHPDDNMGALHAASGTCVLDLDAPDHARDVLIGFGVDCDALLANGVVSIGGTGKPKLWYRAPDEPLQVHKLVWLGDPTHDPVTVLELRAGRVQDVLPPSLHPSGARYRWLRPPSNGFPPLPAELLRCWHEWPRFAAFGLLCCPWYSPPRSSVAPGSRPRHRGGTTGIITRFNSATRVEDLLLAAGYTQHGRRWKPPGSSHDAGVRIGDDNTAHSMHASDPLGAECLARGNRYLDCFDVFRVLQHGGDFRRALAAVRAQLGDNHATR